MSNYWQIKNTMDQLKPSAEFDPFNSIPLLSLDVVPPAPPNLKSFDSVNLSQ